MKKIIINGKEYSSLSDVPTSFKDLLKDENHDGIPDLVANALRTAKDSQGTYIATPTTFIVKGTSYNSLEEMPPEVRREVQQKLKEVGTSSDNTMRVAPAARSSQPMLERDDTSSAANSTMGTTPTPGIQKDTTRITLIITAVIVVLGWLAYRYFVNQ